MKIDPKLARARMPGLLASRADLLHAVAVAEVAIAEGRMCRRDWRLLGQVQQRLRQIEAAIAAGGGQC